MDLHMVDLILYSLFLQYVHQQELSQLLYCTLVLRQQVMLPLGPL